MRMLDDDMKQRHIWIPLTESQLEYGNWWETRFHKRMWIGINLKESSCIYVGGYIYGEDYGGVEHNLYSVSLSKRVIMHLVSMVRAHSRIYLDLSASYFVRARDLACKTPQRIGCIA